MYKKLSGYPEITDWEIQTVMDFIKYEKDNGRDCEMVRDENILAKVRAAIADDNRAKVPAPEKITECTACPTYKGCMTDLVCHTSPVENAIKILECGSLLSPVLARKMSAAEYNGSVVLKHQICMFSMMHSDHMDLGYASWLSIFYLIWMYLSLCHAS